MSPNDPPGPGQTALPAATVYYSRDCKLPGDKHCPCQGGPRGRAQSRGPLKEGCLS